MDVNLKQMGQLDQVRRRLGLSCAAVARRAGVSLPTVQRVMAGGVDSTSVGTLKAIAAALGMDVALAFQGSLEDIRERQARSKATRLVRMAQATSGLEAQAVDSDALDDLIRRTAVTLLSGSKRRLWSDEDVDDHSR